MRLTRVGGYLAVGMMAAAPPRADGDVLQLTNGNRVRGVVAEQSARGVRMEVGLHMHVFYTAPEIARVERESDRINAGLRAGWGATPGADAARDSGPPAQSDAGGEGEDAARSAHRRREAIIANLDLEETITTPEALASQLGRPHVERTALSRAGQKLLEWGYDVGGGLLRIVQFRETAGGYMATHTYEERRDEGASRTTTAAESRGEEAGR